jgi:putative Holliday junction resolvase
LNRVAALDLGDQWTGVALSDALHLFAAPFETVKTAELNTFLTLFIEKNSVHIIVVGIPITLRGTDSEQTKKVRTQFEALKLQFPEIEWKEFDERLSSKQATGIQMQKQKKRSLAKIKEEKLKNHAIAAALILESYLRSISK